MEKILLATLLIFANTILAQDIQMDSLTKTKRLSLGQISNSDDLEINTSSNSIFALIKGTEVNFRLKPDLNAKVLGQVNSGDRVEVLDIEFTLLDKYPYWYKIKTSKNLIGYAYYEFVHLNNSIDEVKEMIFYFENPGVKKRAIKFSNQIPMSRPLLEKIFPNETVEFLEDEFEGDVKGYFFLVNGLKISVSNNQEFIQPWESGYESPKPDNALPDFFLTNLLIESKLIKDMYGIKIGDTYKDIKRIRGDEINTFPGHHIMSIFISPNKIFYQVSDNTGYENNSNTPDISPEDFTIEMIKKNNWEINSISWPSPLW